MHFFYNVVFIITNQNHLPAKFIHFNLKSFSKFIKEACFTKNVTNCNLFPYSALRSYFDLHFFPKNTQLNQLPIVYVYNREDSIGSKKQCSKLLLLLPLQQRENNITQKERADEKQTNIYIKYY